jgi:hypothetical protein
MNAKQTSAGNPGAIIVSTPPDEINGGDPVPLSHACRLVTMAYDQRYLVMISPTLIEEIKYRAWTTDRKLRHASYKGLRELADAIDVYQLPD